MGYLLKKIEKNESRWFAVSTRYKSEKQVKKFLDMKNVECFLPLIPKTKRYLRKVKHYEVPLINCYIFVKITLGEYLKVLETPNVNYFIKNGEFVQPIPEKEINVLKKLTGVTNDIVSEKINFEKGKKVLISSGPLVGVPARLVDKKNKWEYIIEFEHIGIQLRMSVNKGILSEVV
jgi:transcription antitermination factor NusG